MNFPQQVWYDHRRKGLDFRARQEVKFPIATENGGYRRDIACGLLVVEGQSLAAFPIYDVGALAST
jgi:hypothetical protein